VSAVSALTSRENATTSSTAPPRALFKLPPRNEAQKQNLIKYGNFSP
jgi:hypothetical protein